jgi:hypothetical protein
LQQKSSSCGLDDIEKLLTGATKQKLKFKFSITTSNPNNPADLSNGRLDFEAREQQI